MTNKAYKIAMQPNAIIDFKDERFLKFTIKNSDNKYCYINSQIYKITNKELLVMLDLLIDEIFNKTDKQSAELATIAIMATLTKNDNLSNFMNYLLEENKNATRCQS